MEENKQRNRIHPERLTAETIPGAMRIIITPAVSDTALLGLAEISAQNEMGDEILSL